LVHDPAERAEDERRGQEHDLVGDGGLGDDRDEVTDELEQDAEDGDPVQDLIHQRTAPSPYDLVTVCSSAKPPAVDRIRKTRRTMTSAATKSRTIAWMMSTIS